MCASVLMNESLDRSMSRVESLRNVRMNRAWKDIGGAWMEDLARERVEPYPEANFYISAPLNEDKIHAGVAGTERYPLCLWRQGSSLSPPWAYVLRHKTPQEAKQRSQAFCRECLTRLSAGRRARVNQVFPHGEESSAS